MDFVDIIIITDSSVPTPKLVMPKVKKYSGELAFMWACIEGRSWKVLESLYDDRYLNRDVIDFIIDRRCPEDSLCFLYKKNGDKFLDICGHEGGLKERYIKYVKTLQISLLKRTDHTEIVRSIRAVYSHHLILLNRLMYV